MLWCWAINHMYSMNCVIHPSRNSFNSSLRTRVWDKTRVLSCQVKGLVFWTTSKCVATKTPFKSKIKWKEHTLGEGKQSTSKSIPRLELIEGISSTYTISRRWKIKKSTSSIIPKEGTHNIPTMETPYKNKCNPLKKKKHHMFNWKWFI